MTAPPNIGDRVRLKGDETASVFRVASIYLEGSVLFVSLELTKGGPRIYRPVADLAAGEGDR
jgi:hypothetical protein